MKRLKSRVAIVTGAWRGIGAGISRVLAKHGAQVVLTDSSQAVEDTTQEIRKSGLKAVAFKMDITQSGEVDGVVERVLKRYGRIDILVNNAGIYPRKKLVDMSEDLLHKMFDINVFGMFRCAKAVLPTMMEQRHGKIVNVSSVTGPMVGTPAGGQTAYASTKAAVSGFTVALALEVAQYGINVNCVYPGYIDTLAARGLRGQDFGRSIPMGRQGTPEEVGETVSFLVSEESKYITGTHIVIDGGNTLQEEFLGPYTPK